ncbi:LytTR family transcriptional regulator DNA-binding domain-containing protein [Cytophagales bacterium LB-30]|uniref:LytTR family transcriptional regulator DNA-binding domain-containing protein n=1 Tax=Shiella aurantiaca TaxID=3058365 RepID=A0ABT8F880_9BACT|nr:LytTR family transcriptional regulator DNA-binding domain-containing protein [Shiella aurantiaca]MDN4166421.1 LytTR family transcriptional regulator DNA-binding domain-containing protein [Shiella aurantiaca]
MPLVFFRFSFCLLILMPFGLAAQVSSSLSNAKAQKAFEQNLSDSALYYARQALMLAQATEETAQQRQALLYIGQYFQAKGQYGEALSYVNQALPLSSTREEKRQVYNKLGELYGMAGDYGTSLEQFFNALEHTPEETDRYEVYNNLGIVYAKQEQFEKAASYFSKTLQIGEKEKDIKRQISSLNYLSQLNDARGEHRVALKQVQSVLVLNDMINSHRMRAYQLMHAGEQYRKLGVFDSALLYHHMALDWLRKAETAMIEIYVADKLALTFLDQQQYDSAQWYLHRADSLAVAFQNVGYHKFIYEHYIRLYQALDSPKKVSVYQMKMKELNDSIARSVATAKMKAVEQKYQGEGTSKAWPYWAYALIAMGILLALLAYRKLRKRPSELVNDQPILRSQDVQNANEPEKQWVVVQHKNGEAPILVEDIISILKEGKYTQVNTLEEQYTSKRTMQEWEDLLPVDQFFRVNRSAIIQLRYMLNYSFWEYDKYVVRMKEGTNKELVMSRDRLKQLDKQLKGL